MKITFVSTILGYPWGGADALWTAAAEAAAREGHQLLMALAPKTARHRRIRALITRGAAIRHRRRHADTGSRRWRVLQTMLQLVGRPSLITRLQQFDPAIVCLCQGGTADFLVEPDLFSWLKRAQVPYVILCQANRDDSNFSPEDLHAGRDILNEAKAVVFVSRHNRVLAERQFGISLPNAVEIQNPPPLRDWPELAWPPASPVKLATVSRLESTAKGLDLIIPALAASLGHQSDWQLDLYGEGPDKEKLKQLAAAHGISDHIHFRGFVADISTIWQDHHMLLLPSRFEGCSIAMMEAALCGRPVLATPVGGVDEWIVDGETGFVAKDISQAALVDALRRAWLARADWAQMGSAAKQRAHQLLDPQSGDKLLNVITGAVI